LGYKIDFDPSYSYGKSWIPDPSDPSPWLQIGANDLKRWMALDVQGGYFSFTTEITVQFTLHGQIWEDAEEGAVLLTNSDESTVVRIDFQYPFEARAIRIYPVVASCDTYCGLRIEAYYEELTQQEIEPFLDSTEISALQTGASVQVSSYSYNNMAYYYSYMLEHIYNSRDSFKPDSSVVEDEWFLLATVSPKYWIKIDIQGSSKEGAWITDLKVKYSSNGIDWFWADSGNEYTGNSDKSSIKTIYFATPFLASSIKICPTQFQFDIVLKIEAYYQDPLGIGIRLFNTEEERAALMVGSTEEATEMSEAESINLDYLDSEWSGWEIASPDPSFVLNVGTNAKKEWYKIVTQGHYTASQWVEEFILSSSSNGSDFLPIDGGAAFSANSDQNTQVTNEFTEPVIAKTIQINPTVCNTPCAMRLELYFKEIETLLFDFNEKSAIGTGGQVEASSYYSGKYKFSYNLNDIASQVHGWRPATDSTSEYLLISMNEIKLFTGVGTQGRHEPDDDESSGELHCVKSFKVQYTLDGETFLFVDSEKEFIGNFDRSTITVNRFTTPVNARTLRICILTWEDHIGMRVDAYYKDLSRQEILSLYSGNEIPAIANGAGIQFSSFFEPTGNGEIDNRIAYLLNDESTYNAWIPDLDDVNQWMQIGATEAKNWMRILTQGKYGTTQYVTYLYIQCSLDGKAWAQQGDERTANVDVDSAVEILIDGTNGVIARAIRVCPSQWNTNISLRIEAYYKELTSSQIAALDMDLEIAAIDTGAIVQVSSYYLSADCITKLRTGYRLLDDYSTWAPATEERVAGGSFFSIKVSTKPKLWMSIDTLGASIASNYVTSYQVAHSLDAVLWNLANEGNAYDGNSSPTKVKTNTFDPAFIATSIKIIPITWNDAPDMRVEAYFKEICHWLCGSTCTAYYDNTKCTTSCSSIQGVTETDNGDGSLTCACHSNYDEDESNLSCKRNEFMN
jgi:hypothetical protein